MSPCLRAQKHLCDTGLATCRHPSAPAPQAEVVLEGLGCGLLSAGREAWVCATGRLKLLSSPGARTRPGSLQQSNKSRLPLSSPSGRPGAEERGDPRGHLPPAAFLCPLKRLRNRTGSILETAKPSQVVPSISSGALDKGSGPNTP